MNVPIVGRTGDDRDLIAITRTVNVNQDRQAIAEKIQMRAAKNFQKCRTI